MAAKFLTFVDDTNDAATYPVDRLLGMTIAGEGSLLIKFESSIGSFGTDGAAADIVTVTITANKEKDVMRAIGEAIAFGKDSVLVICDDVASEFVHPNILSCTIAVDS